MTTCGAIALRLCDFKVHPKGPETAHAALPDRTQDPRRFPDAFMAHRGVTKPFTSFKFMCTIVSFSIREPCPVC